MATAKKVNTNTKKKKKDSKAWLQIKRGLSALISNDAAIGLRTTKWYGPVIAAILSVIVAVIPLMVSYSKLAGSDVLTTPSGGLVNGLTNFVETLHDKDIDVVLNATTGEVEVNDEKWDASFPSVGGYHVYTHTYSYKETVMGTEDRLNSSSSIVEVETTPKVQEVAYCDLVVYNLSNLDNDTFTDTIFGDSDGYTKSGEIAILKGTDPTPALNNPYATTTLFLGKNCYSLIKSPSGRNVSNASYYKVFKCDKYTVNLKDLVNENSHGEAYSVTKAEVTESTYQTYLDEVEASWSTLFDDGWQSTRISNMWIQTSIWLAIYIGVTVFMGVMIFVITRGKANPYHEFTFWQSQKIAYWSTMSPAILALILGFMVSNFAAFGYILMFGVRVLWMAFRNLRPQPQQ